MRNGCFNINTDVYSTVKHNCFSRGMNIGLACFISTIEGVNLVAMVYNVFNFF